MDGFRSFSPIKKQSFYKMRELFGIGLDVLFRTDYNVKLNWTGD